MNKLETKLLKHYIGYEQPRDEYQQGVINETLTTANLYTFYLLTICMVISLIFDSINHKFTFGTFALFFIQQFNSYYVLSKMRKSGVDITEFDDDMDYKEQVKILRNKTIIGAIQWTLWMVVTMGYIFPTLWGDPINMDFTQIMIFICSGVLFGVLCYVFAKGKLKKLED